MSELKHVLVQVLDESEKQFAESVLKDHGEVSTSDCYVRGFGGDKEVERLRAGGLVVEAFNSDNLSLHWLEPEKEDDEAEALSDDEAASPPPPEFTELEEEAEEVALVQLDGPLRTAWKEQLGQLGVTLLAYKPDFAYKARFKESTRAAIESLDFVARVEDYQPKKNLRILQEKTRQAKVIQASQDQAQKAIKEEKDVRRAVESVTSGIVEGIRSFEPVAAAPEAASGDSAATGAESQAEEAATTGGDASLEAGGRVIGDEPDEQFAEKMEAMPASAAEPIPAGASAGEEADAPGPVSAFGEDSVTGLGEGLMELTAELTAETEAEAAAMPPPPAPALIRYELKCHRPEDIPKVADALKADDRIDNVEVGRVRVRFACEEHSPALAQLSEMTNLISRIDPYVEPEIADDYVLRGIGIEREDLTLLIPWTGNGVLVGVADTGVDKEHPDLKNQVEHVFTRAGAIGGVDENGHGTHVCGIIAGDGTASGGQLRGVATGARLVVQGIVNDEGKFTGLPIDLADLFQEAYDQGVRIHNNSWGMAVKGLYSIDSHEVDEFIYEHPDFLAIFSAGNDGRQVDDDNPEPLPQGNILPMSLRSPATSKNGLTVGACCSLRPDGPYANETWEHYSRPYKFPKVAGEHICGDLNVLAAFSSRGPSDDERIKPDLVAPGTVIVSTLSSNCEPPLHGDKNRAPYEKFDGHYMYLSGTSQAAPVVAGAAAIVREFYIKEHDHQPSAALLKATLINGTQWINTPMALTDEVGQPNFNQGFGRLDLSRTLPAPNDPAGFRLLFADVDRTSEEALNKSTTGKGARKYKVQVEKDLPLRATLSWTDRPTKGLQQDLDLVVIQPDGKKIVGNHFLKRLSAFPTDHRNNIEQVFIEAPDPGIYTITVVAYNTPFEDQGYSLVVTGKLAGDFLP